MSGIKIKRDEELESMPSPSDILEDDTLIRRRRMNLLPVAVTTLLLASLAMAVLVWNETQHSSKSAASKSFAYVEIKTLDSDNSPIAGAEIVLGKTKIGVTDSSGEWRKYLRVSPGMTMYFQAKIMRGGQVLEGSKNISVPPAEVLASKKDDLEIGGIIKIDSSTLNKVSKVGEEPPVAGNSRETQQGSDLQARLSRSIAYLKVKNKEIAAEKSVIDAEFRDLKAQLGALEAKRRQKAKKKRDVAIKIANLEKALSVHNSKADQQKKLEAQESASQTEVAKTLPSQLKSSPKNLSRGLDEIYIGVSGRNHSFNKSGYHLGNLQAALKVRSVQLGFKEKRNAGLKVFLKDLDISKFEVDLSKAQRLVLVRYSFQGKKGSFLMNYLTKPMLTARKILWNLSLHVPIPYQADWKGDSWIVSDASVPTKLWKPFVGMQGWSGSNSLVLKNSSKGLKVEGKLPCHKAQGGSCQFLKQTVPKLSPRSGWTLAQLEVNLPSSAQVYASGFSTFRRKDGRLRYWQSPTGKTVFTIVGGGKVLGRQKLFAGKGKQVSLSLGNPVQQRPAKL